MRVLLYSALIVLLDQASKLIVKGFSIPFLNINFEGMRYGQSIKIIDDFFKITFVENPGMAFGIDVGSNLKLFLSLFSLFASIGLIVYLYKNRNQRFIIRFALALVIAGAVGNLIDRALYGVFYDYAPIFYGKVVDFLHFDFFDFSILGKEYNSWPIFNIADSSVTIGVIFLLLFHNSLDKKHSEEENDESSEIEDLLTEHETGTDEDNQRKKDNDNSSGREEEGTD